MEADEKELIQMIEGEIVDKGVNVCALPQEENSPTTLKSRKPMNKQSEYSLVCICIFLCQQHFIYSPRGQVKSPGQFFFCIVEEGVADVPQVTPPTCSRKQDVF